MSPRLLPRHPKKTQEETAQLETAASSKSFSDDVALRHGSSGDRGANQAPSSRGSAPPSEENPEAGWYPDVTDPGLMRYWDGFHFTGQAKRASPPAWPADEAHVEEQGAASESSPISAWPTPVTYLPLRESETPDLVEFSVSVGSQNNESVSEQDGDRGEEMLDSSYGQEPPDGVNNWGKDTELAIARALTVDTPEAWQEAGHVAAVVSEMAQTMQAAADAKQTARQTAKAAEEATDAARVADRTASDAKEAAEKMAKAAEEAAETARVAAQTAVEARRAAERTAQEAPKVAETAEAASKTAADAKHKAQALEQVVARARSANTPEAWSEARSFTALAVDARRSEAQQSGTQQSGAQQSGGAVPELTAFAAQNKLSGSEAFAERGPDIAPPPVLWKRSTPLVGSGADSLDQVLGVQAPSEATDQPAQGADVFAELGPSPHLSATSDGSVTPNGSVTPDGVSPQNDAR